MHANNFKEIIDENIGFDPERIFDFLQEIGFVDQI